MGNGRWVLIVAILLAPASLHAQVTTATLVGLARDASASVLPGATVVATNVATGVSREGITDARGEFVLTALPVGRYSVRIEMPGFKTLTFEGLELGAAQTVRQTFTLELGELEEQVTVTGEAPLVQTSTSTQSAEFGSQQVRELPLQRRDMADMVSLAPGVQDSGNGQFTMNGVAGGGTGITVDGTEASSDPELRSLSQFGGQNQISVLSLDAIEEIQIVKGVLPAEYGGVAGGQINVITRSGTNTFSGTAFYNVQNEALNAQSFFNEGPKPDVNFHQYGGTLGGPILPSKLFFFGAYEGYKETTQLTLNDTVPYQATKDALLAALPFPETQIVLDTLPLPTEPVFRSDGTADPFYGRFRGLGTRERKENHVIAKGDLSVFNGGRLSTTYTRMRPWTLTPSIYVNNSNDRVYPNEQDRIAALFTSVFGQWVSETRFGWNRTSIERLDMFLNQKEPGFTGADEVYDRRVPALEISGGFETPESEIYILDGTTYSFDQKVSRSFGRHFLKAGFRWMRNGGNKLTPENPRFAFETLEDALANVAQSSIVDFSSPPYRSDLDEFGAFIQDDWRVGNSLTLNLGLRYDYYAVIDVSAASHIPVEFVNLAPATDLRKLDFGEALDPEHPYNPDWALAPRLGFAWKVRGSDDTVLRGGMGYLYSPHLPGLIRQSISDPTAPFRFNYNRTEVAERGIAWPLYTDDFREIVNADAAGRKTIFSVFNPDMKVPHTIQTMLSLQQALGATMAVEVGYHHTRGRDFPLHRFFPLAIDRVTGERPNPSLGAPGGYYVDSEQTMEYDALQTSVRKRFSDNYSFRVSYTLAKSVATQGGDLTAYYGGSDISMTQDFWDPEADRGPVNDDIRHRLDVMFIYQLPQVGGGSGVLNGVFGDWQVSGILRARSGLPLYVDQPSGIPNSRPDAVAGAEPVLPNWRDTCDDTGCDYLNTDAYVRVPVSDLTRATLRRGTSGAFYGPGGWTLNTSFAKNFGLTEGVGLQVRADVFNLLNTRIWDNPETNMNSGDFGRITDAGGSRTAQIGARLTF